MLIRIKRSEQSQITKLLQDLVRIRSVNPPGKEDEIAKYIAQFLVNNGIDAQFVPLEEGRSSVIGIIPGKEKRSIVLCGHIDTVEVNEEKWSKPPFEGIIENGRMYGRGTSDMKGGVALILQAAKVIKSMNRIPRKTLLLALTADEEGAYRGAQSLTEKGFFNTAEFLIVTEPTGGRVFIGEKGELWIRVTFLGKAAHGSTPELGVNAILPAASFCLRASDTAQIFKEEENLGRTSLNIGRFLGGWQINIVPDRAEVELDFRVISETDKQKAINFVDILGKEETKRGYIGFERRILGYHPPIFTNKENLYVKKFLEIASRVKGEKLIGEVGPYCTDAATIVPKVHMPFVIYGPGTIALAHQPDEYIELSSLDQSLAVLVNFLKEVLDLC